MADFGSALVGASAAIVVGFGLDHVKRRREANGVAGALAGEITSIIFYIERQNTSRLIDCTILLLEKQYRVERRAAVRAEHYTPVFDRVSDRIGLLPGEISRDVIMFYNQLRSFRSDYSDIIIGHYDDPENSDQKLTVMQNIKLLWADCAKDGQDVARRLSLFAAPECSKEGAALHPSLKTTAQLCDFEQIASRQKNSMW